MTDSLTAAIATALLHHQWSSDPDYPNLADISAHTNHRYSAHCAVCVGDIDRIAAVAADTAAPDHIHWPQLTQARASPSQRQRATGDASTKRRLP